MQKEKLVWRVEEEPTGRYRSFQKRGWPTCYIGKADGPYAYFIRSDTPYDAQNSKRTDLVLRVGYRAFDGMTYFFAMPSHSLLHAKERCARHFQNNSSRVGQR